MAVRKRTCPSCGKEVSSDSKFCLYCGTELPALEKPKPEAKGIICPVCGRKADAGAKFCMGCGTPLTGKQPRAKEPEEIVCPSCGKKVDKGAKFCLSCGSPLQGSKPVRQVRPASVQKLQGAFRMAASTAAGEMDFGDMGPVISGITELSTSPVLSAASADSPLMGILRFLGSYAGGLFSILLKPKVLLYSLLMAGLWTVLAVLKDSGSEVVKALSWITCAKGGIFGKGCTAVLLSTLFSGGIGNTFKGIGSLFQNEGKGSLFGFLFGLVIGAACCIVFTGIDSASASSMAGISGALLSLQAIGRKDGNLYELAGSLTSGKVNGERVVQTGKAKSLLSGISIGFALMTAVMAMGL
ncbi:MAG: zinc ribbon domain-containing protein [Erysipelotrichaceae bacterium]|nr:zinc ribbon domain-containing protein [Erysipelotrichaceae bacterium]